ncbi:T9SS type A sorting domain-containing protein [Epilithonimonas tenax]|uniref:T9SS type A sorting domain-containing protein n=1 Tax=Epilithonimonas tenax TaxID=191577 RepID=UPI0003FCAD6C|nr:T9SS type A sorting domain-containing protein [Epilithonimonas tenax]
MTKFYSLLAAVALSASINAQTKTVTINLASTGGTAAIGTGNYGSGAERTWTTDGVAFGGKAITGNSANQPVNPTTAGTLLQVQAANGVIYNTAALPGKLISVTINSAGTARESSLYGGTDRLVNSTSADYNVTGGTQVGAASTTGWSADLASTDYKFFAIKRGASASYITSIVIVYADPTMAVVDATKAKANLVKNTLVANELIFGASAKVSVYNTAGQVVKTAEVSDNSRLDVSALPKGTYVVTGVVNGQAVSQKIIKK